MMSVVDHGFEPLPCQNKDKQLIFAVPSVGTHHYRVRTKTARSQI